MCWLGFTFMTRMFALSLLCLVGSAWAVDAPVAGRDYFLSGSPTADIIAERRCTAENLEQMQQHVEIPAPAGGWSGVPQAITVSNVFAGEVMLAHGDKQVCGRMHDARTRDPRFRASIGMVASPAAGSLEPVHVAWATPFKPGWIPVVQLGSPSQVQHVDTLRLLVRVSCMTVSVALIVLALMGGLGTSDRKVLIYAAISVLLLLWQSILNGMSGYPSPWLPVGTQEGRWLTAFTAFGFGTLLFAIRSKVGVVGKKVWLRQISGYFAGAILLAGLVVPLLQEQAVSTMAMLVDEAFALGFFTLLLVASLSVLRHDRSAIGAIALALPFAAMFFASKLGSRIFIEYRIEIIQLSITWCQIVLAYGNAYRYGMLRQQRDEMRILADTDALTGLLNRRAGMVRLEHCFRQAKQSQQVLTLGFVDIDFFKNINDRHGHHTGDRVLIEVANTLTAAMRENRDVIRMGGEEFLVLLPGVGAASARQRLEAIRLKIMGVGPKLAVAELKVTASMGVASLNEHDDCPETLLRRADDAMYRAKGEGRNRVMEAEENAALSMPIADNPSL